MSNKADVTIVISGALYYGFLLHTCILILFFVKDYKEWTRTFTEPYRTGDYMKQSCTYSVLCLHVYNVTVTMLWHKLRISWKVEKGHRFIRTQLVSYKTWNQKVINWILWNIPAFGLNFARKQTSQKLRASI